RRGTLGNNIQHTSITSAARTTTGSQVWAQTGTGYNTNSNPTVGADGTVYIGTYAGGSCSSNRTGRLYALDPTNGSIKWSYLTGKSSIESSTPTVANGTVYVSDLQGVLYAVNADGSQKWVLD